MIAFILWIAKRLGVTRLLAEVIVFGGIALVASGSVWYMKHSYDEGKRDEGRAEVVEQARKTTEANRLKAEEDSRRIAAEHAKTEAALRRRLAAIRAEKSDACSEAPALPSILEGLR